MGGKYAKNQEQGDLKYILETIGGVKVRGLVPASN